MYLFDFVKYLGEQFAFIFNLFNSLFDVFMQLLEFRFMPFSLPPWLMLGFEIMLFCAVLFRISQFFPIIGGANS